MTWDRSLETHREKTCKMAFSYFFVSEKKSFRIYEILKKWSDKYPCGAGSVSAASLKGEGGGAVDRFLFGI